MRPKVRPEVPMEEVLSLIHQHLTYDAYQGKLFWKQKNHGRHRIGKEAGCVNKLGYRTVVLNQRGYLTHRIICLLEKGSWPLAIDHIDGNPSNNSICNLRNGTQQKNCENRSEHRKGRLIGTTLDKRKQSWCSQGWVDGKKIHFGTFKTELDAHKAFLSGMSRK